MTAERVCDRLAVALLIAVAVAAALTFRDYGLGWDDYTHSQYGDLLLSFFVSGLRDRRALSWVNLYYYGGGFDLLSAAVAKLSPFTLFETRRLVGAAIGILGLVVTWRLARRIAGPLAGVGTLALLAACPLYYGHMFVNAKDAPFAVTMTVLLYVLVRVLDEYPRVSLASAVLVGLAFGLAFGSRIMGAFGALELLGALAFMAAAQARADGLKAAGSRTLRFMRSLLPGAVPAYLIMALVWPWAAADPLNPFRALQYFSRFFEKPWSELFAGAVIAVPDMPRSYVPTLFGLKLPEIFLVLALSGAGGALVATCRSDLAVKRRAVLLLIALAAFLPPIVAVALRPAMYNGIRHFVFVLPPLAILGGFAFAWLVHAVRAVISLPVAAGIVLALGLALPTAEIVRLHPYEYTYFNSISGGVAGASQALLDRIAAGGERKPSGRPWRIAVCGPHRSPEVELGPDFEITWDPADADFAMMLGEFYCRKFDAPLVAEIVRDRVTYARVYDIRGRSYDSLLTLPGI
ncbi:MAG: hypothetical protein E6G96_06175 [Alphaproteobacteria bacterium]|nr:MAG: hypothetical protein E6G96_06175 [Alphaproteobacteria bacterium]